MVRGRPQIKALLEQLYPLNRTIVSEGMDAALEIIGRYLPASVDYGLETYPPKKAIWTWEVPERYRVHEAYLEIVDGERIVDFCDNPLHVVSYSLPIDRVLAWDELEGHLHYSTKRPHAIPWIYKYYDRDWGFCLSKDNFDQLPRNKAYHAVIRSEFVCAPEEGLKVGVGLIRPEGELSSTKGELLICTHLCHPCQANDDAAGVAVAVEVGRRLAANPLPAECMSVRFLFCPETIGSICYLSHHEDLIEHFKGGIFIEMPGNRNVLALQRTRQDNHLTDQIARYVLQKRSIAFREDAFLNIVRNDERVINGPGVNIPCISLSRWPFDEYHTSDDNLDIVHEELLVETADVAEEIVRIFASNYIPRRRFRGPIFLSRYGLWVDWKNDWEVSLAQDRIMLMLEGKHSVFDIAQGVGLDYWRTRDLIEGFYKNGLIDKLPIPSSVEDA